ncbi:MAG: exo-beta-N-acetylmuramidase NamZ domain-containing protein [Planctomycetota bacterium]
MISNVNNYIVPFPSNSRLQTLFGFFLAAAALVQPTATAALPGAEPHQVGLDAGKLSQIDDIVARGLEAKNMPGCVVLVARRGQVAFLKSYGYKRLRPEPVPMTTDTVFDMASITKPVATATSIMILVDRELIRLEDPVAKHIPEFGQNGKEEVTVFHLLTHQGGVIPDNSLADYADGPSSAWERIFALGLKKAPGEEFIYSDVGYMVLAEMVKRITGQNVHDFTQENIFQPLEMQETGYLPDDALRRRAAPTERRDGRWMQGEVHDPRAYALSGIAGHAGLFSTAEDLAIYAQMMLNGGHYAGTRVLSHGAVARMTAPGKVSSGLRGLGWDIRTGYSSNRGEDFTSQAFGHGGFTGTTLWMDPGLDLTVIFLSNRLHPDGKGAVNKLAGEIGGIAATAILSRDNSTQSTSPRDDTDVAQPKSGTVLAGIDVLRRHDFRQLKGRKVGLITNHTGVARDGTHTLELLHQSDVVDLVALFSPEHGLKGKLEVARIADFEHQGSGLPVYSLYGKVRRPTSKMLAGMDTLVFDIQDIGTRFYTYISTMGHAMEAAAEEGIRFVVLDRPNPINGVDVSGPMLDPGRESFVAFHRLPIRHGMTVGELATLFNEQLNLELDLQVIRLQGWRRSDFHDATGLKWVNPSPNMRNLSEAILYPGIGLLETTNLSVGRGTDTPFEIIGAPWLNGVKLARDLAARDLPGVRFVPVEFTPEASKFSGQLCHGINVVIADRRAFEPVKTGLEIARQIRILHPENWNVSAYDRLLRNRRILDALRAKKTVADMEAVYRPDLEAFRRVRDDYLLYPE